MFPKALFLVSLISLPIVFLGCAQSRNFFSFDYGLESMPFECGSSVNIHGQDGILDPRPEDLKFTVKLIYPPKDFFDNTLPTFSEPEIYFPLVPFMDWPPSTYPGPYDKGGFQPTYPSPAWPQLRPALPNNADQKRPPGNTNRSIRQK